MRKYENTTPTHLRRSRRNVKIAQVLNRCFQNRRISLKISFSSNICVRSVSGQNSLITVSTTYLFHSHFCSVIETRRARRGAAPLGDQRSQRIKDPLQPILGDVAPSPPLRRDTSAPRPPGARSGAPRRALPAPARSDPVTTFTHFLCVFKSFSNYRFWEFV
jgi:hypothetical protein